MTKGRQSETGSRPLWPGETDYTAQRPGARFKPFYEAWFEKHEAAYLFELLALRPFVPWAGRGIEIDVGSGRFAAPLGIQSGVDPSPAMLVHAAARGIQVVKGTAENLPFEEVCFDHALVVTTVCFMDSPAAMLEEGQCFPVYRWRQQPPIGGD